MSQPKLKDSEVLRPYDAAKVTLAQLLWVLVPPEREVKNDKK